jgi:hypothetical protein
MSQNVFNAEIPSSLGLLMTKVRIKSPLNTWHKTSGVIIPPLKLCSIPQESQRTSYVDLENVELLIDS